MMEHPEAEKVREFINAVVVFARGGHTPFGSIEELANQAIVILSIEQLCIQINTLESIKHLLTDKQIKDIDAMIKTYEGMKAKLYGSQNLRI